MKYVIDNDGKAIATIDNFEGNKISILTNYGLVDFEVKNHLVENDVVPNCEAVYDLGYYILLNEYGVEK